MHSQIICLLWCDLLKMQKYFIAFLCSAWIYESMESDLCKIYPPSSWQWLILRDLARGVAIELEVKGVQSSYIYTVWFIFISERAAYKYDIDNYVFQIVKWFLLLLHAFIYLVIL